MVRDENKYIKELIIKLEEFFELKELKERICFIKSLDSSLGIDIRDYSKIPDWSKKACGIPIEDNSKISKEVIEIVRMLSVLYHYKETPEYYDNYIRDILNKCKSFNKNNILKH